jgi:hypothetical protein
MSIPISCLYKTSSKYLSPEEENIFPGVKYLAKSKNNFHTLRVCTNVNIKPITELFINVYIQVALLISHRHL